MRLRLLAVALGVVMISAGLRLVYPNSLPIFADESIYIRWAQVMRAESSLRFLPLSDGKQPLFMWLVIPFLKIFTDPLVAGRILSAGAGVGTIIGVSIASFLVFKSPRAAVLGGLIYAVIPFAVFFDRMALVDSLLVMFLVWTFVFSWLAVEHTRLDAAMLAGFALGFAWLTKSPAMFGLLLLPTLLLIAKPKKLFLSALILIPTYLIAFGMYNILRLGPEFQMIAIRNKDYVYSLAEIMSHPLDPVLPHLRDVLLFYLYLATPLGLPLVIWGILAGTGQHWRKTLILGLWCLVPIVAEATFAKTLTARYLLPSLPFAVLLIVHALEHIGQKTKHHQLVWLAAGLIVLSSGIYDAVLIANPQAVPLPRIERAGYLEEWTAGYGIKEVANQIRLAAQNGPVIVGSEGFFGTPFSALQMYLNNQSNVRVVGVGVWIDRVSPDLTNALADNQVFLVVNSSRFYIANPEKVGLKLIASYPKAIPPSGDQEYLLFFKVNK